MRRTCTPGRSGLAILSFIAVLALIPLAAACGDDDDDGGAAATLGDLRIFDPWVRATTNDVTAGYFRVENDGGTDTLIRASANIPSMVQLHEVVTEGASSKMQEKEGGFRVPDHGTLELKPGDYHLMLMNLKEPLKEGDTVELELTFEMAGTVTVVAPVRPAASVESAGGPAE